ncbi:MAG: HEPN domain-containing protein [Lachnospiraceae bacterium]|jgi:HEPN domain-containing protein|nr:HEPN domain-containing protein [Lachnospiraceae bacterium]
MSAKVNSAFVSYDNALSNIDKAKKNQEMCDAYLKKACENIYAAIELYLKGIIELLGEKPQFTHQFGDLVNQIADLKFNNDKELQELCNDIGDKWESLAPWHTATYKTYFSVTEHSLGSALRLCERLQAIVHSMVQMQ